MPSLHFRPGPITSIRLLLRLIINKERPQAMFSSGSDNMNIPAEKKHTEPNTQITETNRNTSLSGLPICLPNIAEVFNRSDWSLAPTPFQIKPRVPIAPRETELN